VPRQSIKRGLQTLGMLGWLGVVMPAIANEPFARQRSFCLGELRSQEPAARIQLRSGAGTDQPARGYGVNGDLVFLLAQRPPEYDTARDRQGKVWYRVGFPASKATGWVRSDLVRRYCLVGNPD